jgi:DNA invertase Pin-like site-specific DNA recombinase
MRKITSNKVPVRLVGYARVSTIEQNLDMQVEALRRAGVAQERIHVEKLSASNKKRPKLDWAISVLRPGDVLVVWKLDRIARSLSDMLYRVQQIETAGAGFKSLTEQIDTTTPAGRLLLHVIGSLAQFERDLVVQRTRAGVAAAKARGVVFGQPKKLDDTQAKQCRKWKAEGKSVREIQALVKQQYNIRLSQQTVWKTVRTPKK